jgi:hypothetical protein
MVHDNVVFHHEGETLNVPNDILGEEWRRVIVVGVALLSLGIRLKE